MRKILRLIAAVCMAVVLSVQTALPAAASGEIEGIFGFFTAEKTDFYEGLEFGGNDWAAYCRIRLYGTDGAAEYLSRVESAAEEMLGSDGFVKPTDLQRAAILLSAAGRCSEELINAAVYFNEKLDRQGINAYIWGLIAVNCCGIEAPQDAPNTKETLAGYIISKQLSDGGFALTGGAADADITSAAIYALAPLCENAEVYAALVRAEQCLSEIQLPSGGFTSMGKENCDSTAQAVTAFCALGFDEVDSRVAAAIGALENYRTGDGGYSHNGGSASGISSAQCLVAYTSLELTKRGESLFSHSGTVAVQTQEAAPTEEAAESAEAQRTSGDMIRFIIAGAAALLGIALVIIWLCGGRKKPFVAVAGAVALVLAAVTMFADIRTPEEYYAQDENGAEITVMLSVDCSEALKHPEKAQRELALPQGGFIIPQCSVSLPDGATAFDALVAAAKPLKLTVDHSSSLTGTYIVGIGGLYEFDFGAQSGWLYEVNGESPSSAASACALSDGDVVRVSYTCQLGQIVSR